MSEADELAKRIATMDEDDQNHFKKLIMVLSKCYVETGPKAVITISHPHGLDETITINCDDMEAYEVAHSAAQYLEFVNVKDAPPKEQFN